MKREWTVHLVHDSDETLKYCDGEKYTPPQPNQGDKLILCKDCASGRQKQGI